MNTSIALESAGHGFMDFVHIRLVLVDAKRDHDLKFFVLELNFRVTAARLQPWLFRILYLIVSAWQPLENRWSLNCNDNAQRKQEV